MASGRTVTRTAEPPAVSAGTEGRLRRRLVTLLLLVAGAACYVGVVAVRQGPPDGGDTLPLITVSSAVAAGDLRAAASNASLPNPPGYALWTAPLVAAFPSSWGAPSWCTTVQRADALRDTPGYRHDPTFARDVGECGPSRPDLPPW